MTTRARACARTHTHIYTPLPPTTLRSLLGRLWSDPHSGDGKHFFKNFWPNPIVAARSSHLWQDLATPCRLIVEKRQFFFSKHDYFSHFFFGFLAKTGRGGQIRPTTTGSRTRSNRGGGGDEIWPWLAVRPRKKFREKIFFNDII